MKDRMKRFGEMRAFTLIELLVTVAVLSIFILLVSQLTDGSFKIWRSTQSQTSIFAAARQAFDVINRRLSQATLNTYLDYYDAGWNRRNPGSMSFQPARYGRASELHFYSGPFSSWSNPIQGHALFFFAPLGFTNYSPDFADLPGLLNPVGYLVEWGRDDAYPSWRPSFLSSQPVKYRYRLVELLQPSQEFKGYPALSDTNPANDQQWILDPAQGLRSPSTVRSVLAENVLAIYFRPELPEENARQVFGPSGKPWQLTVNYQYDSRSEVARQRPPISSTEPRALHFAQTPPLMRVIMVAVDERSAARLVGTSTTPPAAFQIPPGLFANPANLEQDIRSVENQLADAGCQYRVFNELVRLRGAQFSTRPENLP